MDRRRLNELRSIALHIAIAVRLRNDPWYLEPVKERLRRDLETAQAGKRHYAKRWLALIESLSLEALCQKLGEDSEEMRDLRQSTPFTGILLPSERDMILALFERVGALG